MKVIIAGSRTFSDKEFLFQKCLDIISKEQYDGIIPSYDVEIVSGHNPNGADYYGECFSKEYKLNLKLFPADWNDTTTPPVYIKNGNFGPYNAMAGNVRNEKMTKYVITNGGGILIAFSVDGSSGTKNMVSLAKRYGIKSYVFEFTKKNGKIIPKEK